MRVRQGSGVVQAASSEANDISAGLVWAYRYVDLTIRHYLFPLEYDYGLIFIRRSASDSVESVAAYVVDKFS